MLFLHFSSLFSISFCDAFLHADSHTGIRVGFDDGKTDGIEVGEIVASKVGSEDGPVVGIDVRRAGRSLHVNIRHMQHCKHVHSIVYPPLQYPNMDWFSSLSSG